MDFTINEAFASHYNEYRQKEEFQKLKSRYGDVKLRKTNKEGENEDLDNSEASSSSSDSDSSWEEQEHEDFLRLYGALCRDDPSLANTETVWFRSKNEEAGESIRQEKEEAEDGEEQRKGKPVLLKDHTREFLLSHGGVEDDEQLQESTSLSKIDTLKKLQGKEAQEQKQSFLVFVVALF